MILTHAQQRHAINALLMMIAMLFSVIAFTLETITVASGDYTPILRWAVGFSVLAALLLSVVIGRGPVLWRVVGAAAMLPLFWIVCCALERDPQLFGY